MNADKLERKRRSKNEMVLFWVVSLLLCSVTPTVVWCIPFEWIYFHVAPFFSLSLSPKAWLIFWWPNCCLFYFSFFSKNFDLNFHLREKMTSSPNQNIRVFSSSSFALLVLFLSHFVSHVSLFRENETSLSLWARHRKLIRITHSK